MKRSSPIIFLLASLSACNPNSEGTKGDKKELGEEKSEKEVELAKPSVERLDQRVRDYIEEESERKDGHFELEKDGKTLELELVRVHTEYISTLGPQRHFACVDLAEVSGDVYDVDFFLEGSNGGLEITQETVHKRNGIPFYTWGQKEDGTWHRVPVEEASKEVKGVIQGKDTYRFHYEATLPEIKEEGELWIPIAPNDRFQNVEIKELETPDQHRILKEKAYGNRILYMRTGPEHSGERIKLSYEVERKEKAPYKDTSADPDDYLRISTPLIPVNDRFERITDHVLEGKKEESRLVQARALFEHVIDTVEYKKAGTYGTGDAEYACSAGKGNCSEFHSYFIALARAAGIPARFAIGASIPSSRDEGGINGYHCWAEFYAQGEWWPVDISEAKKYGSLKAYYFGHHPANRLVLSKGRGLQVDPAPTGGPIEFLAYPLLEVDGEEKQVETRFSFTRKKAN